MMVRVAVVFLVNCWPLGATQWPHAADELPTLSESQWQRPASQAEASESESLRRKIFERDIFTLSNCPCREAFSSAPLERQPSYYVFDTSGEIPSGLNHQQSNLKAIITEGLSLGRSVLLRKPTLTRDHNFHRAFKYNMWSDFVSFNRSTFTLTYSDKKMRHSGKKTCTGRLADCVTDVSEAQLAELVRAPHTVVHYRHGAVNSTINAAGGLLVRGPAPYAKLVEENRASETHDKVALVRKLPGFPEVLSQYHLKLDLAAPDHVASAVPPVTQWLQTMSSTGKIAVVHVRRGDKIQSRKYCPKEMRTATSPQHIAKVLERAGVPSGSAVYVMSDETDFNHFRPLMDTFNYKIATNIHFDHLHSLLEGCSYLGQQKGLPCENYLLFAIEKEIINAVPPDARIVTIPRHDLLHNPNYLMNDFLGPGKPCRSL